MLNRNIVTCNTGNYTDDTALYNFQTLVFCRKIENFSLLQIFKMIEVMKDEVYREKAIQSLIVLGTLDKNISITIEDIKENCKNEVAKVANIKLLFESPIVKRFLKESDKIPIFKENTINSIIELINSLHLSIAKQNVIQTLCNSEIIQKFSIKQLIEIVVNIKSCDILEGMSTQQFCNLFNYKYEYCYDHAYEYSIQQEWRMFIDLDMTKKLSVNQINDIVKRIYHTTYYPYKEYILPILFDSQLFLNQFNNIITTIRFMKNDMYKKETLLCLFNSDISKKLSSNQISDIFRTIYFMSKEEYIKDMVKHLHNKGNKTTILSLTLNEIDNILINTNYEQLRSNQPFETFINTKLNIMNYNLYRLKNIEKIKFNNFKKQLKEFKEELNNLKQTKRIQCDNHQKMVFLDINIRTLKVEAEIANIFSPSLEQQL